jgi:hypothetical protein
MCEDVSWIEYQNNVYFLQNSDLETKEGQKLLLPEVKADVMGHGAIEAYYPELKDKGQHKECTDFSTPKNFPKKIVKAIKEGKRTSFGIHLDILNDNGKKVYEKIKQLALAEYEKIEQPAWAEYEKIKQLALAEYEKIKQLALAEYMKIQQSALAEYMKIQQSALAEYMKIQQPAWAEYEKIQQLAFSQIVKQKKYRSKEWK